MSLFSVSYDESEFMFYFSCTSNLLCFSVPKSYLTLVRLSKCIYYYFRFPMLGRCSKLYLSIWLNLIKIKVYLHNKNLVFFKRLISSKSILIPWVNSFGWRVSVFIFLG